MKKRKALIPDPRNDENLIVAQTHLAMIRFHNRVVDKLPASMPAGQKFRRARKSVTLHYQWLIRHDFLPRIVQENVLDDVFTNGRKLVEPTATPVDVPTMPVEFSVAAFRLGHSMVRPAYDWNRRFPGRRRVPVLHVRLLRRRRQPGRRPQAREQLDRRLAPDVRLPGGGPRRPRRRRTASTRRSGSTPWWPTR